MIAAGQWQPVIGESELPGGKLPETARERETGCPGFAASSPYLLTSRKGRWPRSSCGFMLVRSRIGSGFGDMRHSLARAVWLKQSRRRFRGGSGKRRNPRLMRSGVAGPGPHSIFWGSRWSLALDIALRYLAVPYLARINSLRS